jgi:hypothetical protein
MTDDAWVVGLDTSKPNMARIYDWLDIAGPAASSA